MEGDEHGDALGLVGVEDDCPCGVRGALQVRLTPDS